MTAGKRIRCGRAKATLLDCHALFAPNKRVVLKAAPAKRFVGWRGFCSGRKPRCEVRTTAPKTIQAIFRR